jgi:hypothetical protein
MESIVLTRLLRKVVFPAALQVLCKCSDRPNVLIVTISEYGPIRSGIGYTYDTAEKVLVSQFGEKGKRLTRISADLPDFIKAAMHVPMSDTRR